MTTNFCSVSEVRCILVGKTSTDNHIFQLDAEIYTEIADKHYRMRIINSSKPAMFQGCTHSRKDLVLINVVAVAGSS